jgi:transcriptional regulator with XRE-family HTH domain
MLLGSQLRRLREAAGVTTEDAGHLIRASRSKISRMETGRVRFKIRDVSDLLSLYGISDEPLRARFLALARQSSKPDWWAKYCDILPDWFETYLGLEAAASCLRSFETQFVPALFQTEDYARAVIKLSHRAAPDGEVDDRVAVRVKRQDLLTRPDPPKVWSIIDESVLRRPVASPAVMRAQFEHLIEVASMPHVTVQVMPFTRSGHSGESGPFSILRFQARDLPDVVYIEHLTSAIYLEQRPDVEHYLAVMDRLSGLALPPAGTRRFIEQAARGTWPSAR